MEKTYTPEEAAEILKVIPYTVRKWLRDGKIKGTKLGRMWRISESELKRLLSAEK